MRAYLQHRRLSYDTAVLNKWYPTDIHGTPRIVIPTVSRTNSWSYYQARAMDDHPKRYLSPAGARGDALVVCYPPGDTEQLVIAEGPMDALAATCCAVGVGLMGNTPSEAVLSHLLALARDYAHVTVVPDSDACAAGSMIAAAFWSAGAECFVKPIPYYKDLAEMPQGKRYDFLAV